MAGPVHHVELLKKIGQSDNFLISLLKESRAGSKWSPGGRFFRLLCRKPPRNLQGKFAGSVRDWTVAQLSKKRGREEKGTFMKITFATQA